MTAPEDPSGYVYDGEHWRPVTSYEEWRVTGTLADRGEGSPYAYTWRASEAEARRLFEEATELMYWRDGPHLHRRTVTVTEWEAIEP